MKRDNRAFKHMCSAGFQKAVPDISEEHLRQTAVLSETVYRTCAGRARIGFGELLVRQIKYIGWKIWLMQFALLIVLVSTIGFLFLGEHMGIRHVSYILCAGGLLMVWSAVPMIGRSIRYRMFEIENTSFFSGGKVLIARLAIICSGVLAMLAVILWLMTVKYMYTISQVVFALVLPLLAAGSLFLILVQRLKLQSVIKGCNLAGAACLAAILFLDYNKSYNLMELPKPAGWTICAICFFICVIQVKRIWKKESYAQLPDFG